MEEDWLTEWTVSKEWADIFPLETDTGRLQTNRPQFSLWQELAYLVFSQTLCRTHYCVFYFKEILYYTSRLPQTVPVKQPVAFCQWKERNRFAQFWLAKGVGRAEWSVGGRSWWHWVITMPIFRFLPPELIWWFLDVVISTQHFCSLVLYRRAVQI